MLVAFVGHWNADVQGTNPSGASFAVFVSYGSRGLLGTCSLNYLGFEVSRGSHMFERKKKNEETVEREVGVLVLVVAVVVVVVYYFVKLFCLARFCNLD